MIGVIFQLGSEIIEVRVIGDKCFFKTSNYGGIYAPIDNIKIDRMGAIKEFPDLEDDEKWREKTIERFKEKLRNLKTEMERIKYLIDDLKRFGYKPMYLQRPGFRPEKL